MRPQLIRFVLLLPLLLAATTGPSSSEIDQAVVRLGSDNAAVRAEASHYLWSLGLRAEPALRSAAASDDPEVAHRARLILGDFDAGLFPDSPRELFDLQAEYRAGNPGQKQAAVKSLENAGPGASRLLLKMSREEKDAQLRSMLLQAASTHAREAASALIADGDLERAGRLLHEVAPAGAKPARDRAAFLLIHGGLAERIAATTDEVQLTFLRRAAGDLPAAMSAAVKLADDSLIDHLLIEQRDWPQLAARLRERLKTTPALEGLGFLAAYERLAGDEAGVDKTAEEIKAFCEQHPDDTASGATALFLNDRVDAGLDLLKSHNEFLLGSEFFTPRLMVRDALALLDHTNGEKPDVALKLRLRAAAAMQLTGDHDGAERILKDAAAQNQSLHDMGVAGALVETARELGDATAVDDLTAATISMIGPSDNTAWILEKAGIPEGELAARWYRFLRGREPATPPALTLDRVRALQLHETPAAEVRALVQQAQNDAMKLTAPERDAWLFAAGQTMQDAGELEPAEKAFADLCALSPSPAALTHLGDCQAAMKRWDAAVASYGRAWDLDRSQPASLLLKGWVLTQRGQSDEGRRVIELAHLLPLGDEAVRHAVYDAAVRHGLSDEARRERELVERTGEFLSWELCEVLRRSGDEASGKQDYASAADLWQRAFLANLGSSAVFTDPWANVMVPALVRKTKALALMHSGDLPGALREARACMKDSPADTDALIDMVCELQKLGRKAEADELFNPSVITFRKFAEAYPQSGQAHNLVAWVEGKCRRNLDEALTHAKRAVELEPNNTASLDTLAEVYFQRGQIDDAIAAMNKCVALEPQDQRHRKQIERFKKGL